jgi:ATP-dependent RNA helicase DeaD
LWRPRKNARHDQQRIGNISQIDCILDEADEMLNMGFYEDIVNILSTTPDENTWLFSATMPAEVARIGNNHERSY